MPVRASVEALPEPGHAILRVSELEAAPDGLALSIQRQQGPDSHLADDGWRRTEAWLMPARVERRKGALDFHLGPEICDRLAGVATVRLRVKEPDIGVVGTTVVAWPAMLTSGAVDPSSRNQDAVVRLRRKVPPPAPPFEPPPAVEEPKPRPELRALREPEDELEGRRGRTGWLMAAAILVILAGAGYFAYTNYFQPGEPEVVASATTPGPNDPPRKSLRVTVAEYLATKPTPEQMLAKGQEFAQVGEMGGAFLLWRQAAEAGNPKAQLEVAAFYDPLAAQPRGG